MKIQKTTLLALAVLVLVITTGWITGCTKQSGGLTIKPGVLMVGMELGYPPMEYYSPEDGRTPMGFDVDMGKAIAEKMGLKVEYVDTAWDGIFAGVETNRYDCIMSSVTITEARLREHNFSRPYIGNALAIVTRKDSAFKPQTPQELAGLGVSYQAETTSKFFMEKLVAEGLRYTPFEYDKVMNCFDELKLNRVDVIVTDSVVALDYTTTPDTIFEITWLGEPDEFFGIVIKKGNDPLTEAIDNALDELFADGTMREISIKNLHVDMVSAARQ